MHPNALVEILMSQFSLIYVNKGGLSMLIYILQMDNSQTPLIYKLDNRQVFLFHCCPMNC